MYANFPFTTNRAIFSLNARTIRFDICLNNIYMGMQRRHLFDNRDCLGFSAGVSVECRHDGCNLAVTYHGHARTAE